MQKFSEVLGVAVAFRRGNVDTDQIIPAQFLKRITKTGFEDALFYTWRKDPDFVLNRPENAGASILFAGPDFGTGSSREHAVWALRDYGFRAVFSSRFGDIFRGNAGKQGLLAGLMAAEDIEEIWDMLDQAPGSVAEVILEPQTVSLAGHGYGFEIDPYTKWRLIEGLDDISLTLRKAEAIAAFEKKRFAWLPKTFLEPKS